MEDFIKRTCLMVLFNQLFHVQDSKGSVEVSMTFVSFRNQHWFNWHGDRCDWTNKCDPFFVICVDKHDGNDGINADRQCEYLFKETGVFPETNNIDFEHDMHGVENPIIFKIPTFATGFMLKVSVHEQDRGLIRRNERVDYLVHKFVLNPGKGRGEPGEPTRKVIQGRRGTEPTSLTVDVISYCAENHVSNWETCDAFCKPQDSDRYGHYNCSGIGDKICLKGWKDPLHDCKTSIDDCPEDHSCKNGGECQDGHLTYFCKCPPNRKGPVCTDGVDPCDIKPCSPEMFCNPTGGGGYECSLEKIILLGVTAQAGLPSYVIGLIAAIILVILLVVILVAVIWMMRRNKKRKDQGSDAMAETSNRGQQTMHQQSNQNTQNGNVLPVTSSSGHMNPGFSNDLDDRVYENNANSGAKALEAGILTPPPYREWEDTPPERPPPRGSRN